MFVFRWALACIISFLFLGNEVAFSADGASSYEGSLERGALIYQRCKACHSIDHNRSGPKHCGLFGRKAGSIEGYRYSKAMRESDIIWDEDSLDRFLSSPFMALPGTAMGYAGVKDNQERADLIAYLKAASAPENCARGERSP